MRSHGYPAEKIFKSRVATDIPLLWNGNISLPGLTLKDVGSEVDYLHEKEDQNGLDRQQCCSWFPT